MFVSDPKKPGGWVGGWESEFTGWSAPAGVPAGRHPCCSLQPASHMPPLHALAIAVGGHVLAHASTVRLSVRKGKAEQRLMKVRLGVWGGDGG